jgi:hypothetical protein
MCGAGTHSSFPGSPPFQLGLLCALPTLMNDPRKPIPVNSAQKRTDDSDL